MDLMDCENPADLLTTLLSQLGGSTSISTLCKVTLLGEWEGRRRGEGRGEEGRGREGGVGGKRGEGEGE
jgi:hypothetical protein